MNQIAQKLKEKNIAEYLIYMWQEEDLIRANHCEMEEMEANVIARYPEDQRPAMREWYGNLITMMSEEGVREKGHLQINKNIIRSLPRTVCGLKRPIPVCGCWCGREKRAKHWKLRCRCRWSRAAKRRSLPLPA